MAPARSLVLGIALSAGLLIGLEALCRVVGWGEPMEIDEEITSWDREWSDDFYLLGPRPGVNPDGVYDREHSVENPEGRRRVVFLGDSVTFGYALPQRFSYPSVVESLLASTGAPAEVFNVALPGWSTRQARIAYRRIVRKYHPDLVVLGFCLNDVAEMQNNLSATVAPLGAVYSLSYLVRALMRAEVREIRSVRELFAEPLSESVRDGWQRTLAEIRALSEEVIEDGAAFSMIVLPFRFQLEPGAPEPRAQRELLRFGVERGIPTLDVLPRLREIGPQAFLDRSHLSASGARRVAEAIVASNVLGAGR